MRLPPSLIVAVALLNVAACKHPSPGSTTPAHARDRAAPQPLVVHDTALEQRAGRLELKTLEQEAEIDQLQQRLDDARREVVRAMAKLQSLATRAEAASGMAEAEIALQALRSAEGSGGSNSVTSPELAQGTQLLQLATGEFDKQNYAGALYLATEAKNAAGVGQGRVTSDRATPRAGEVPFALPLHLQTTGRANVREGPGGGYKVLFTVDAGAALTGYAYVDQWVRIKDDGDRSGWIHQSLIDRRQ